MRLTDIGAQQALAELGAVAGGRRAGFCEEMCCYCSGMVTLEGPFYTPGAEEEMLGQAGQKEEPRQRWAPAELQEALWTLSGSQGCPLQ